MRRFQGLGLILLVALFYVGFVRIFDDQKIAMAMSILVGVAVLTARIIFQIVRLVARSESPRVPKEDWVVLIFLFAAYLWLFSSSSFSDAAPWFQATYKWSKLIVSAVLWFHFGFGFGQRVKYPDDGHNSFSDNEHTH